MSPNESPLSFARKQGSAPLAAPTPLPGPIDAVGPAPDADSRLRAGTYGLLASLLSGPPASELLQRLAAIRPQPGAEDEGSAGHAYLHLGEAARETTEDRVAREYQELFIGITEGEIVPYGSWYGTGSLMDRPLVRLRSDLARLGFEREAGMHDPEDHAAVLCEVMGRLVGDEGDSAADEAEAAGFFTAHLGPWMPRFFADLQQCRSARFYRAVGELGEGFMALESVLLSPGRANHEGLRRIRL